MTEVEVKGTDPLACISVDVDENLIELYTYNLNVCCVATVKLDRARTIELIEILQAAVGELT